MCECECESDHLWKKLTIPVKSLRKPTKKVPLSRGTTNLRVQKCPVSLTGVLRRHEVVIVNLPSISRYFQSGKDKGTLHRLDTVDFVRNRGLEVRIGGMSELRHQDPFQ